MTTSRTMHLAIGSVAVGVAVLALKYVAYLKTGSVALYSDALESILNVATAMTALIAVRISAIPADDDHPFGHSKVEYLSAVIEGALIIVAAFAIFHAALQGYLNPRPLGVPFEGLAWNGAASLLNAFWAWMLITQGRKHRAPALSADGRHLMTDVLTSIGVLIGLSAAYVTGIGMLDPLLAACVALNILWMGWKLMKESIDGLMDKTVSAELLAKIRGIISAEAEGAIEVHDLRSRQAGRITFIEFHLVVDGTMSVADAHEICDRIETSLEQKIAGCNINIHVEPPHKAKHTGIVVL